MPKDKKFPVDRYSRGAFEEGIEALSEGGVPYIPISIERNADPEWQLFYEAATDKEREIISNLDRMYTIAMRVALADESRMELERQVKEAIPQLKEAQQDVERTILKIGDSAPQWFLASARGLVKLFDEAIKFFGRPASTEEMHQLFGDMTEGYLHFKEQAFRLSSPDRFQKI